MTPAIGVAIFFTMWWVVLFAILPIGVRSQHEDPTAEVVPGSDPGAPMAPMLLRKALATTAVTIVLFAALWWYMTAVAG